ncbi:MAG TPA: hydroxymethylbilane synthase [Opitutaceae bacterium]
MGLTLALATRKSPLALAQAALVAAFLRDRMGAQCEIVKIVTTGDRQAEWSLEEKGGKGLFTRELEEALLRGEADLAIHSAKDLPGEPVAGLSAAGYLPREDPRDLLVLREGAGKPRTIATGSPRRRHQAARLFGSPEFSEIRGNVDTRLKKIADQHLADATILAVAGLKRLGIASWPGLEFQPIAVDRMVPAVGQGAIAVQCRCADEARYAGVFDAGTARGIGLERSIQSALGGGCHTALGAYVATDTLYFFHEDTGLRTLPLSPGDLANPDATAARVLSGLGLK